MSDLTEAPNGLRALIAARRADLERRYGELSAEMEPIRVELQQIALTERTLSGLSPKPPRTTLQQMAAEIIKDAAAGLTTSQVAVEIKARFGRDVPRESLAPQLSRLQHKGVIVNESGVHRLAGRTALSQPAKGEDDA